MRSLFVSVSLCVTLAGQNASQGPIKVIDPVPFPALGPSGLSSPNCAVAKVRQLELRRHPSFASPAVFHVVAAIQAPSETRWKLCTGVFDCDAPLFTPDTVVDLGSASIFAGSVTHDLKTLVCEVANGFELRTRSIPSGPFGPATAVAGVPAGARDPKLCRDDGGGWRLAWAMADGSIRWCAINLGGATLTGATTILVNPSSQAYHSPEPLRDPNGVARAFLLGRELANPAVSDAYYASGKFNLPPAVTHHLHNQGTYLRGGTAIGGTAFVPQGPTFGAPLKLDFSCTNCDQQSGGGTATICSFFPYKSVVAEPEATTVFLGLMGNSPIQIPGVHGRLGLDPLAPLFDLGPRLTPPYTGVTCWSLAVPVGLGPLDLATQSVLVRLATGQVFLGNNSTLRLL